MAQFTEGSVRMRVFVGYFCKRIFLFFRKHESLTKVKGTVHVSHTAAIILSLD